MQSRPSPTGVSRELLHEEFFGKAEPLYFTYRKQYSVGVKGAANTLTNTDLQKEVKISCRTQIIPSKSNTRCESGSLIWGQWLKGVRPSSRRKQGQTCVPQNIIFFFFYPVTTAHSEATWGNSGPPLERSSTKLTPEAAGLAGYFVATLDVVDTLELML